jgi:hypothetical protein
MESTLDGIDLSSITDGLIHGEKEIETSDIDYMNRAKTYFYASNNLVAQIENPARSSEEFHGTEIRVNGFWKDKDSASSEFSKYRRFDTKAKIIVAGKDKIVVQIDPTDKEEVENYFRTIGIKKPDFGLLVVVFRFAVKKRNPDELLRTDFSIDEIREVFSTETKTVERAFVLKYTHNPLFSNVTQFRPPVSAAPSKNIYRTPAYTAETIFVPKLEIQFVYNYYEKEEVDYAASSRKNYQNQKLSDIPKYIRLTWTRPSFDMRAFEEAVKPDRVVERAWNPPINKDAPGGETYDPYSAQRMKEISQRLMDPGRTKPTEAEAERERDKALAKSVRGNTNTGVVKDWLSKGDKK